MSLTSDQMELREDDIRKHYPAATALLNGFEHAPRIAKPVEAATLNGLRVCRRGGGSGRPRRDW